MHVQKVSEVLGYNVKPFPLDGKIHRCDADKKGDSALWMIGGGIQKNDNIEWVVTCANWKTGCKFVVKSFEDDFATKDIIKEWKRLQKKQEKELEKDRGEKAKECREKWVPLFEKADASPVHDYMLSKGLTHNYKGRNSFRGMFLIPVSSHLAFEGVQIIKQEGDSFTKRFSSGIKKKGSFCSLGLSDIKNGDPIYFCEGYATGCSIWEAIKKPTIVCFDCNNLLPVLESFRRKYKHNPFVVCADNDQFTDKNPGETKAVIACKSVLYTTYVLPKFKDLSSKPTDFNDLHCREGIDEVKLQIKSTTFVTDQITFLKNNGFTHSKNDSDGYRRLVLPMATYFTRIHNSFYIPDIDVVYGWNGKYYEQIHDVFIKNFAQRHYFDPVCEKEHEVVEFLKMIKRHKIVKLSVFEDKTKHKIINFNNGMFNPENGEFKAHDPSVFVTHCLPVDYNPKETSPTWDSMMATLTGNRTHLISVLEEFFGYCILGGPYDHSEILVLKGGGANGKSTVLNIVRKIIGNENCSAVSLAEIPGNRFLTISMKDSLVNFSEEEPKKVFKDTGMLKRLSGKSPIKAEQKGKPVHMFENRAKLVMSYNEMPELCDFSDGIKRRLLIVPFDADLTRNPHLKIENVHEKIDKELSGIVNRFITGLHRLRMQGNFTHVYESNEEFKQLEMESNEFVDWWENCVGPADYSDSFISNADLKASFLQFTGEAEVSNRSFGYKLSFLVHRAQKDGWEIEKISKKVNNQTFRGINGIVITM